MQAETNRRQMSARQETSGDTKVCQVFVKIFEDAAAIGFPTWETNAEADLRQKALRLCRLARGPAGS